MLRQRLARQAKVESITASNAIKGVEVDPGQSRGGKRERVRHRVLHEAPKEFRVAEVRNAVVGVGDRTIRTTLRTIRDEGMIESVGSGPGAYWRRIS